MTKEREEVIQLLIKIDNFRYQGAEEKKKSKRRIIEIFRIGMKPSRGLKESIDSVKEKYSWETGKITVSCFLSIISNLIFGWSLFAFDVGSDLNFYVNINIQTTGTLWCELNPNTNPSLLNTTKDFGEDNRARIVTLVHIILPFVFSTVFFFIMLCYNLLPFNWYLPWKIPLPPLAKMYKTIIECKSFKNNKNIEESNYETRRTDLLKELEDQENITTISMILEASLESSFQFCFQGLFSLPTLVLSFEDVFKGDKKMTDLVNWKIVSIVMSFLSFALTSFNIR